MGPETLPNLSIIRPRGKLSLSCLKVRRPTRLLPYLAQVPTSSDSWVTNPPGTGIIRECDLRNARLQRRDTNFLQIANDSEKRKGGRKVSKGSLITVLCIAGSVLCMAQQDGAMPPALLNATKPAPVLSGGVAFVPTWDSGNPTLISIIAPVLLVPLNNNLVFESRAAFEGDFQRRNGNSGDFTGAIQKTLEYMELDYIGNRYITVTAGRFLTPFNIFNERLYPNWIRNTQTDPLILPLAPESDNGLMLRGGVAVSKTVTLNYATYFSVLSTADHFESERHTGVRTSIFLPRERFEIGASAQHQLQDERLNRYGLHLQWQPRRLPFDLRAEGAYSRVEGNGLWVEGAYRLLNVQPSLLRRTQVVGRTQVFQTGTVPGINPSLPGIDTKRTEVGVNCYVNDGWKALASYGRTFTPSGDSNIWTVGMTYRFVLPLGPGR